MTDYFVSTKWIDKKGTFRIIRFNSEDDPCFVLQNYKTGTSGELTSSNKFCSVELPSNEIVDVSLDYSGGSWFETFEWSQKGLSFILNSSDGKFKCNLNLYKLKNAVPRCVAI
jgi:hypothetical protein